MKFWYKLLISTLGGNGGNSKEYITILLRWRFQLSPDMLKTTLFLWTEIDNCTTIKSFVLTVFSKEDNNIITRNKKITSREEEKEEVNARPGLISVLWLSEIAIDDIILCWGKIEGAI